jgi:hypothetical protein
MEAANMSQAKLKVGPLADQTPVKVTLAIEPDLNGDLKDYAAVHSRAYGKEVTVIDLIPSMLRALMDGDAGFKRARRQLNS